jgi:hypothetical protein
MLCDFGAVGIRPPIFVHYFLHELREKNNLDNTTLTITPIIKGKSKFKLLEHLKEQCGCRRR